MPNLPSPRAVFVAAAVAGRLHREDGGGLARGVGEDGVAVARIAGRALATMTGSPVMTAWPQGLPRPGSSRGEPRGHGIVADLGDQRQAGPVLHRGDHDRGAERVALEQVARRRQQGGGHRRPASDELEHLGLAVGQERHAAAAEQAPRKASAAKRTSPSTSSDGGGSWVRQVRPSTPTSSPP